MEGGHQIDNFPLLSPLTAIDPSNNEMKIKSVIYLQISRRFTCRSKLKWKLKEMLFFFCWSTPKQIHDHVNLVVIAYQMNRLTNVYNKKKSWPPTVSRRYKAQRKRSYHLSAEIRFWNYVRHSRSPDLCLVFFLSFFFRIARESSLPSHERIRSSIPISSCIEDALHSIKFKCCILGFDAHSLE